MNAANFKAYRLYFHTPLHIGDMRPDDYSNCQGYIHSDTLHAALIATWAKIGTQIPVDGKYGFHLSSMFPFFEDESGKTHYFFPRPLAEFPIKEDQRVEAAKPLKKVQWLDQFHFENLLSGKTLDSLGDDLQGNYCCRVKLEKPVFTRQMSQRVTIPRERTDKNDPKPFYMERLLFRERAGLYFLFKGDDETAVLLEKALNLLQYEGIGTDRTIGNGLFTYGSDLLSIQVPDNAAYATNISLFCPENREELRGVMDENARFEIVKRGGWITTPGYQSIRKQPVYMFREGGVWRTRTGAAGAQAIDLRPGSYPVDHPVWRNGSGIFLPIKIKEHGV